MRGPRANPTTYKLTPRIMTSWLTPNSVAVTVVAVDQTELPNETTKVIQARIMIVYQRYALDQFRASTKDYSQLCASHMILGSSHTISGSLSESQVTISDPSPFGGDPGGLESCDSEGSLLSSSFSPYCSSSNSALSVLIDPVSLF
jgi:hypothetical protein